MPTYLTGGKTPLERVCKLLPKLHFRRVCKDKGPGFKGCRGIVE